MIVFTVPGMGLFIHSKRNYVVASAPLSGEGGGRTFNDCGDKCEGDSVWTVACEAACNGGRTASDVRRASVGGDSNVVDGKSVDASGFLFVKIDGGMLGRGGVVDVGPVASVF